MEITLEKHLELDEVLGTPKISSQGLNQIRFDYNCGCYVLHTLQYKIECKYNKSIPSFYEQCNIHKSS